MVGIVSPREDAREVIRHGSRYGQLRSSPTPARRPPRGAAELAQLRYDHDRSPVQDPSPPLPAMDSPWRARPRLGGWYRACVDLAFAGWVRGHRLLAGCLLLPGPPRRPAISIRRR